MFDTVFSSPAAVAATDERAWVAAMLEVEAALARALARAGLVPPEAAATIAAACGAIDPDPWPGAAVAATPVIALVEALRSAVPLPDRRFVHYGATSQDIVDSAMMLVAHRVLLTVAQDLAGITERLAALVESHGTTPQLGRTLMRSAVPSTFGAVVSAWLTAVGAARAGLARWRPALQLGGPVGTRTEWGPDVDRVVADVADQLGLAAVPPWHTDRTRVAELAAALGICAGTLAKVAGDVILLSQDEIGELSEAASGGSSAMPGKRNPARAVLVVACAHRVPAFVATLLAGMPQELQRAAGRWQAEWPTLTDLLRVVAGAAHHGRAMLDDLVVHPDRMAERVTGR